MIRIGETHYCHMISGGRDVPGADEATEAVKRLVEAAKAIEAARTTAAYVEAECALLDAVAPFTDTDASLVDSGPRSCATPENEETGT